MKIIIPVKNEEDNIIQLLDSIPNNIEIFVVFNGTTDDSILKVREYLRMNDRKINYLESEPGKCNAINKALELITDPEEIILHLDADIILAKDFFDEFNKIVWDKYLLVGGLDIPKLNLKNGEAFKIYEEYLKYSQISRVARGRKIVIGRCFAYKRNLIQFFPKGIHSEDNWITFNTALKYSWDSVYVNLKLNVYFQPASDWTEYIKQKIRFEHGFFQIMKEFPSFEEVYSNRRKKTDKFDNEYFMKNIKSIQCDLKLLEEIDKMISLIVDDSININFSLTDIWTKIK